MRKAGLVALLLTAGCVPAFQAELRCPVPAPNLGPMDPQVMPTAFDVSVRDPAWWQRLIRHGSDVQLDAVIQRAAHLPDVPQGAITQTRAAVEWRRANGCAQVPNDPLI